MTSAATLPMFCLRAAIPLFACFAGACHGGRAGGSSSTDSIIRAETEERVTAIAVSVGRTCGLTASGNVKCWYVYTPDKPAERIALPGPEASVHGGAANTNTCAVMVAGSVMCWDWQLTDDGAVQVFPPKEVLSADPTRSVTALAVTPLDNSVSLCALVDTPTTRGSLECGELPGDSLSPLRPLPPLVLLRVSSNVRAFSMQTRAISIEGIDGSLSRGVALIPGPGFVLRSMPTIADVATISSGGWNTCVTTGSGSAQCWGVNSLGELGDGTTIDREAPVPVVGLTDAASIALSATNHVDEGSACALSHSGTVSCWGQGTNGQLGSGPTAGLVLRPTIVTGLQDRLIAISSGTLHTCGLTSAGHVKCWGAGPTAMRNGPVDIPGF